MRKSAVLLVIVFLSLCSGIRVRSVVNLSRYRRMLSENLTSVASESEFKTVEDLRIVNEFEELQKKIYNGTFNIAKMPENINKNRYYLDNLYSLDQSRVVLSRDENVTSDFINANYVDGYKQKNAFISTQGPLENTVEDFWWMIWQERTLVIAMITKLYDGVNEKCFPYWKFNEHEKVVYGNLVIKTASVQKDEDYTTTKIEITNLKLNETRNLTHFHFTSWPDLGVPSSPKVILNFIEKVKQKQADMLNDLGRLWTGNPLGPPIVVHCSAGIGRTGTFITIFISMMKFKETGDADIKQTVESIRQQRAGAVETPEQYLFCYKAIALYEEELSANITILDVNNSNFSRSLLPFINFIAFLFIFVNCVK